MVGFFDMSMRMKPLWGALKNSLVSGTDVLSNTEKIQVVATTLQCNWIRLGAGITVFNMPDKNYPTSTVTVAWDGSSNLHEQAADSPYFLEHLVVIKPFTANPLTTPKDPFVAERDLPVWGQTIGDIIDTYKNSANVKRRITHIIIDNEQQTDIYHEGTMHEYVDMLRVAYGAAHSRDVLVSDGGILSDAPLYIRTYQYVASMYGDTEANAYADERGMSNHMVKYAQGDPAHPDTDFDDRCADLDLILQQGAYVDYWNMHFYEVPINTTTGLADINKTAIGINVLRYQTEFVEYTGKKPILTNESGTRWSSTGSQSDSVKATLATNLYNEFYRLRFKHIQLWDGEGGSGAIPFTSNATPVTTGNALSNGTAFKTVQLKYS